MFLFCSEKHKLNNFTINNDIDLKQEIILEGNLSYFNYNGFLSGELVYNTDVFIL